MIKVFLFSIIFVPGVESVYAQNTYIHPYAICGSDDRQTSQVKEVGRVRGKSVCSGGLIGKSCFVTAGHCIIAGVDKYVEFNTPPSRKKKVIDSDEEDVYVINQSSIVARDHGTGNDFAVFRLKKNQITGQWPGDVQGYFEVDFRQPKRGIKVRVSGYGTDSEPYANLAQQTHVARLQSTGSILGYNVDTTGGNSGSSVINERTGKIIGIHTTGGCGFFSPSNQGTSIAMNRDLKAAIKKCLRSE